MAIQHLMRLVVYADTLANIQADIGTLDELVFGVDTATNYLYYSRDDGATWVQAGSSTTVATDTIWDAKGDLAVGTGANTAQKLTVGANGTVPVADSAETVGLKYVSPSLLSGVNHLHGLARWTGDGSTTTFELPDIAEQLELVFNAGSAVDPATVALSSDRTQVVFSAAPTAANVLQANYILAQVA